PARPGALAGPHAAAFPRPHAPGRSVGPASRAGLMQDGFQTRPTKRVPLTAVRDGMGTTSLPARRPAAGRFRAGEGRAWRLERVAGKGGGEGRAAGLAPAGMTPAARYTFSQGALEPHRLLLSVRRTA